MSIYLNHPPIYLLEVSGDILLIPVALGGDLPCSCDGADSLLRSILRFTIYLPLLKFKRGGLCFTYVVFDQ